MSGTGTEWAIVHFFAVKQTEASDATSNVSDLVRRYFHAYETKDRKAVEDLLSDDFTFTSPYDDHIDKATYFERCWRPNSERIRASRIEKLFDKGNEALIRYELQPKAGESFRNTEHFTIEGGKIKEVDVYFGLLPEGKD